MLDIATSFYKHLFGYYSKPDIHRGPSFWKPEEKVTVEENTILDAPLSEEEIKFAIFSSYADGPLALMASLFCFTRISGI